MKDLDLFLNGITGVLQFSDLKSKLAPLAERTSNDLHKEYRDED
jgi:hypothetical protein